MTLIAGTKVGIYEVVAILGRGGMGEVYRARDAKLHRDVALKVLPDSFATDPDRLARFEREAQILASMNHPHIAAIYGFEETGPARALVLELVEGPTLADRIAEGPLPIDEALPLARQIAEALAAAHEHGIVHRDLKPANIKVRDDGTVKVLDFGLAKTFEPAGGHPDVSQSPTVSMPPATRVGIILGTAGYMSPEQAKGRPADKRSDIWAFGCVLYEMLTGKRAFDGDDMTEVLGAVVHLEPNWARLPSSVPSPIRTLPQVCLVKDRGHRVADVSTALFVLDKYASLADAPSTDAAQVQTQIDSAVIAARREMVGVTRRRVMAVGLGSILTVGAATGVWLSTGAAPQGVTRLTIAPLVTAASQIGGLAITSDGRRVLYVAPGGTDQSLFVRPLDQLEPTPLVSATQESNIFTSPDGQWVGYVEEQTTLKKVPMAGGPSTTLLTMDGSMRGVTWLSNDTIVFATSNGTTGLQRVSAAGGPATVLTQPDQNRGEGDHLFPESLPNGRAVLFTISSASGGRDDDQVALLDLATDKWKSLVRGGRHARYAASGHLVYTAGSSVLAIAFDLDRLELHGTPVPVLRQVAGAETLAGALVSVAANGTMVYVDAPKAAVEERTLVWVDRRGRETPLGAPPGPYMHPRLSPDGTRVVVVRQGDVWLWDLRRATMTRLTLEPGMTGLFPVWTPDGRRVVLASTAGFGASLYAVAADGTSTRERLIETSSSPQFPSGLTPDGAAVVFFEETPGQGRDLRLLPLAQPRRAVTLLGTRFDERNGVVSPSGRWLAYESNSSGRQEIFVRPFPDASGSQRQVSIDGGRHPLWAANGQELLYLAPDGKLMSIPAEERGTEWSAGKPTTLLATSYFSGGAPVARSYDVSPDGQRFLMVKPAKAATAAAPTQIVVVQNWFEELARLVPGK